MPCGETKRVGKGPIANVGDLAFAPVVAAAVFRYDDIIQYRAQLLSRDPEQDLRLGDPRFHIEVVVM